MENYFTVKTDKISGKVYNANIMEEKIPDLKKKFQYRGLKGSEVVRGEIEAPDKDVALEKLSKQGIIYPSGVKESKKPGFLRKHALKIGLATGILAGGGYGVKKTADYMGQGEKHVSVKKIERKDTTDQTKTNKIYTAPASTNLTAEAERLKEKEVEEITTKIKAEMQKKLDEQLAEKQRELEQERSRLDIMKKAYDIVRARPVSEPVITPKPAPESVVASKPAPETDRQFWERVNQGDPNKNLKNATETMRWYQIKGKIQRGEIIE